MMTGSNALKELFKASFIAVVVALEVFFFYLFMMLASASQANAEGFDPEKLSLSTVRIVIKSQGQVVSVASGFVWKDAKHIVTSLHVLGADPNATVIVEFGKKRRKAKIKSILPEADLVMLEVKRPLKDWSPLGEFNPDAPKYKSFVTALGFNKGALGMSTRELVKGYAKPEILEQLLPGRAAKILAKTQMPSVTLPIYYLDGSLLPGYSGSPIVNAQGDLIGIGNGGLESGASSVSWVIPAVNLTDLEASPISVLPEKAKHSSKLFTLDKIDSGKAGAYWHWQDQNQLTPLKPISFDSFLSRAFAFDAESALMDELSATSGANDLSGAHSTQDANTANSANSMSRTAAVTQSDDGADAGGDWGEDGDADLSYQLPVAEAFKEVDYQHFHFTKVKTRSFAEMLASSGNPKSIERMLALFDRFFPGYTLDLERQSFDVYTDAHYGLNLILPQDTELTVEDGFLLAKGDMFCRTCAYEVQYHARNLTANIQHYLEKNARTFLHRVAEQHWQDLNAEGDYQEYVDFRQIEAFGNHRHVLRAAFSDFDEPFKNRFELNYFVAAHSRDAWFQVQGILNPFDDALLSRIQQYQGTDCTVLHLSSEQVAVCREARTAFNVLASTHFTSFSNQIFSALASPPASDR